MPGHELFPGEYSLSSLWIPPASDSEKMKIMGKREKKIKRMSISAKHRTSSNVRAFPAKIRSGFVLSDFSPELLFELLFSSLGFVQRQWVTCWQTLNQAVMSVAATKARQNNRRFFPTGITNVWQGRSAFKKGSAIGFGFLGFWFVKRLKQYGGGQREEYERSFSRLLFLEWDHVFVLSFFLFCYFLFFSFLTWTSTGFFVVHVCQFTLYFLL